MFMKIVSIQRKLKGEGRSVLSRCFAGTHGGKSLCFGIFLFLFLFLWLGNFFLHVIPFSYLCYWAVNTYMAKVLYTLHTKMIQRYDNITLNTSGVEPGIFNGGGERKYFLRRKAMVPGRPYTVRRPVSAKTRGVRPVSVKIRGGARRDCPV